MTPEQKIDVLKLVYTEEAEALRFEVSTAQRLMTYFATLELALGAWIVAAPIADLRSKWLLFGLNVLFSACVAFLIILNYRRRTEVVDAMRGAVEALGLLTEGEYLPGRPIHRWRYNASWKWGYIFLIALFCGAQALPIFLIRVARAG
jgi:hypothetical protein